MLPNTTEAPHVVSATLMGGLGNQLFQMAAAYALETPHRTSVVHLPSICPTTTIHTTERYADTVFSEWPKTSTPYDVLYTEALKDAFIHRDIVPSGAHFHIHGYFQQEMYFKHCLNDFISRLRLPSDIEPQPNTCFIHLRYGDFLKHAVHSLDLLSHYLPAAMQLHRNKHPGIKFLVFSDDLKRCRTIALLETADVSFAEDIDAVRALVCMSKCEAGGICSNSSFGWWGAYLNTNPEKLVTFPRKWMQNDWPVHVQFAGSVIIDYE